MRATPRSRPAYTRRVLPRRPRPRPIALAAAALACVLVALTGCAAEPVLRATAGSPPAKPTLADEARGIVAGMDLRDRIASLLVLHVAGTDPAALQQVASAIRPGGFIFMGDNVGPSAGDVAALAASVQDPEVPLLLSVDQEGGVVDRLPGDTWGAGAALHDLPASATTEAFAARGALVRDCGLNLNFGVVADVTADPSSFIHDRTLGATPELAAEHVAAAVAAEADAGVLSTLKHFPGHGAAPGDSHTSLPRTSESLDEWRATDALPFAAGIDAGAPTVMMGHLVYDAVDPLPASQSPAWHSILRDDLGFTGPIVSDDMVMLENSGDPSYADRVGNAIRALTAGTTLLLYVAAGQEPVDPVALVDGLTAAVQDGRLPEATVDDAAALAMEQRLRLAEGEV